MTLPTPDDLGRAPAWQNYIIAQVVQASLGSIPEHTLAMSVEINGNDVRLHFQLTEASDGDIDDIEDIVSEMEALVGSAVRVESAYEIREERLVTPSSNQLQWIFLARI